VLQGGGDGWEERSPAPSLTHLVEELLTLAWAWLPALRGRQASNILWALSKVGGKQGASGRVREGGARSRWEGQQRP